MPPFHHLSELCDCFKHNFEVMNKNSSNKQCSTIRAYYCAPLKNMTLYSVFDFIKI